MKKILILIIACFFSLNIVCAKDEPVGKCQYKLEGEIYDAILTDAGKEKNAYINLGGLDNVSIINYNSEEVPMYACGKEYKPYSSTPHKYIQDGNGCPKYLHIGFDSNAGGYYGFFSQDLEPDCPYYKNGQVLENIDPGVNKNEQTGVTTPNDDTFILTFSGIVQKINVKFDVTVNKTKKIFSNPESKYTINGEYEEYDPFENVFVCSLSVSQYVVYPNMQKYCDDEKLDSKLCNLNYLNNCANLYSTTSANYLITEGCPLYNRYYTAYQDTKDNDNLVKLKNYCQSVTNSHDYSENKYSCINLCLNISDYLPELKTEDGRCGFSWDLINFIANIIKWGKYLIPVIVIVLGILDFIKAIAADKEDEMKKAQGRFVKRLIAAALIFIVPFIIEFILDKMGFDAFGCGIIDL